MASKTILSVPKSPLFRNSGRIYFHSAPFFERQRFPRWFIVILPASLVCAAKAGGGPLFRIPRGQRKCFPDPSLFQWPFINSLWVICNIRHFWLLGVNFFIYFLFAEILINKERIDTKYFGDGIQRRRVDYVGDGGRLSDFLTPSHPPRPSHRPLAPVHDPRFRQRPPGPRCPRTRVSHRLTWIPQFCCRTFVWLVLYHTVPNSAKLRKEKLKILVKVRIPAVHSSTAGVCIPVFARDGGTPALDLAQRFLSFAEYREVIEGGTRPRHRPKVTFFRLRSGDTIRKIIRMRGKNLKNSRKRIFYFPDQNFYVEDSGIWSLLFHLRQPNQIICQNNRFYIMFRINQRGMSVCAMTVKKRDRHFFNQLKYLTCLLIVVAVCARGEIEPQQTTQHHQLSNDKNPSIWPGKFKI